MYRDEKDVLNILTDLDLYCKQSNVKGELVILGGSAFLTYMGLENICFRTTLDIDVNIIATSNESIFKDFLKKLQIDVVGGIMEVPPLEDFENNNELIKLDYDFEYIEVYLPKLELLACTKIFSTRVKDLEDLEHYNILEKCDKIKLLKMVEEYKRYLLNPSNPDLNVHQLNRILKEKGI